MQNKKNMKMQQNPNKSKGIAKSTGPLVTSREIANDPHRGYDLQVKNRCRKACGTPFESSHECPMMSGCYTSLRLNNAWPSDECLVSDWLSNANLNLKRPKLLPPRMSDG